MDLKELNLKGKYRHPWELSRTECLFGLLKRRLPQVQYMDIGAGDLFFTQKLREITSRPVYAVDVNYSKEEEEGGIVKCKTLSSVTCRNIDCIIMMDVLEHIENDKEFIREVLSFLREGGLLLITVPAFQSLFGPHDVFLRHLRRYTKRSLVNMLKRSGLEVEEVFYFYTVLLPFRIGEVVFKKLRLFRGEEKGIGQWKFSSKFPLTLIIKRLLDIDFSLNRKLAKIGLNLGGLSLCVLARKK